MSEAYDAKNAEDYEANTTLLIEALEKIGANNSLPASIAQLSRMTGLHRNTIADRGFPKGQLQEIKEARQKEGKGGETGGSRESHVRVLEEKLNNAFKELVYWFNKHQSIQHAYEQLATNYARMMEAKNLHQKKYLAEKQKNDELRGQINLLTELDDD